MTMLCFWAGTFASSGAGWKFLVCSDSQAPDWTNAINTTTISELGRVATNEGAAFVLFGGDFANGATPTVCPTWTNLMSTAYQAGIPTYPAMGNHDIDDIPAFRKTFGAVIPDNGPTGELEQTFAFTYSNALFLVLNTFGPLNTAVPPNQGWIDAVLATNTLPHVFVMGHAPAFKLGHINILGAFPAQRDVFWNSLSNAHCRMYFCGHDHFYDHTRLDDGDGNPENDVHQFIVGTAGADLYGDSAYNGTNGIWTPIRVYHEKQWGYLAVEVDGNRVTATWHHRTGPDTYEPTAEVFSYSANPAPVLRISGSGAGLTLTWDGSAVLQAAPEAQGIYTNVPGASSPFAVINPVETRLFYRLQFP